MTNHSFGAPNGLPLHSTCHYIIIYILYSIGWQLFCLFAFSVIEKFQRVWHPHTLVVMLRHSDTATLRRSTHSMQALSLKNAFTGIEWLVALFIFCKCMLLCLHRSLCISFVSDAGTRAVPSVHLSLAVIIAKGVAWHWRASLFSCQQLRQLLLGVLQGWTRNRHSKIICG